jgi:hypothetical protein
VLSECEKAIEYTQKSEAVMDLLNSYTKSDLTQVDKAIELREKLALLSEQRRNKEASRKEVAFLSIRAAETFELGQTAIENLMCQSRLF